MSPITCNDFRDRLERALRGRPERTGTMALAWHEHLLSCAECRSLLEAEEALEELLSSLPDPRLPAHLVTRVLARLIAHRTASAKNGLDRLLELDHAPAAPADLAPRVLAGLDAARRAQRAGDRLDSLLQRVPSPTVPAGLSHRILSALEPARRPAPRLRLVPGGAWKRVAVAAVVLTMGLVAWRLVLGGPDQPSAPEPEFDADLIASLGVLERWPLLMSDDLDLLLAGIDPLEESLFEVEALGEEEVPTDTPLDSPPDGGEKEGG